MEQTTAIKRLKNPPVDYICYFCCKFFYSILTCTELYYFSAFLTDTALFSLGIIGTIQMVTTVIDFIFSFFYGQIMESVGKHLPWGITRSWLAIAPPIVTVLFAFAFVRVSESEVVSAVVIIIGFLASHVLWSVGECAMNAQTVNMTEDQNERAQMSINLGRGTNGSSCVFGIIAGAFLGAFATSPLKYVYMIIVFGILYWIGFLLTFWRSKGCEPSKAEYEAKKAREKKVAEVSSRSANLLVAYKAFFTSRNGWAIFLSILFGYCYMFLVSGTMFYYFSYTQLNPAAQGSFMSIRGVVALIGSVFWVPLLLKLMKGNKKITMVISYFIAAVTMFLPYLAPVRYNFMFFYVISLICSLLGAGGSMLQVGVLADIGAELTYKHKKELNNYTISFLMLPLKLSLILRSALITAVIGMTGYTEWLAAGQPDSGLQTVRDGMALGYCAIPALLAVIAGLSMLFIYKLPEEKAHEYVLANKKDAEENEARVNAILAERGEL